LVSTVWVGKEIFGKIRVGILAIWLLAIPTVNVTLYTTVTLGGYGEMLLIGNLILLSGFRIAKQRTHHQSAEWWNWFIFGFLSGLGLWAFGLTLVYSLPVVVYLGWLFWKDLYEPKSKNGTKTSKIWFWVGRAGVLSILGILIGALPWLLYAWNFGLEELIKELGGSAIAGVEGLSWWSQLVQHGFNLFILGSTVIIGIRPPWEIRWLGLPLIPFILFFWIGVLIFTLRQILQRSYLFLDRVIVLIGVGVTLIVGFLFTPFGADPSGRYFLPLSIILALLAADMIFKLISKYGKWLYVLVGLILIFHLWGTVQSVMKNPPGLTTQFDAVTQIDHRYDEKLIDFLLENGELHGYSNYWVSYPLAFKSGEKIIFVPRLPYHQDYRFTDRDDRYEPYRLAVQESEKVAYITTNHPGLEEYLRGMFEELEITWQEQQIGDYRVFYSLSESVRPVDIGLGETTP
jgi:hypothetical protein